MSKIPLLVVLAASLFASASGFAQDEQASPAPSVEQMQAHMQAMQALMARIQATEDPAERQQLMQQYMQSMNESMSLMGRMMHGPMGQSGRASQCPQDDTKCELNRLQMQQQMMGRQMGMMQQMMQQMMQGMNEQMMHGPAMHGRGANP